MPPPSLPPSQDAPSPRRARLVAACFLLVFTVLLCLIPKPENDLFFELRIGADILRTGHLPRFDTYSWTNFGTPWDVPEWLSFVLYALCFRVGGFWGTWLLMTGVVLAATGVVWGRLSRVLPLAWAFGLACLMLLALSDFVQERPYVFTYLFLAGTLCIVTRSREKNDGTRGLWTLALLCVVWTNLHQGVLTLVGLLIGSAAGDIGAAIWARAHAAASDGKLDTNSFPPRFHLQRARRMLSTALACALAVMVSPYGWRVYRNVFVTLRDRQLMANVTEWRPITVLPLPQMMPFLILLLLTACAFALSRRRNLPDGVVLAVLVAQAIVHARGVPLFAIGAVVIGAPHLADLRHRLPARVGAASPSRLRGVLLGGFAIVYAVTFGLATWVNLRRAMGPRGLGPEGIGEAVARVPDYPDAACAFTQAEGFPSHLRLLNNFEIGGFLMERLPQQPVFIDGRLDVCAGRTFDDNLVLSRAGGTPQWAALVQKYDLDCVLTTNAREARAFGKDPQWQLVYADPKQGHRPRCRILLRRRPQFAALIARCLHDRAGSPQPRFGRVVPGL